MPTTRSRVQPSLKAHAAPGPSASAWQRRSRGSRTIIFENIIADEVGIEFALVGKYRARASYTPVYTRAGSDSFVPVAVRGGVHITLNGQQASLTDVLADLPEDVSGQALDILRVALMLRNIRSIDGELSELIVDLPDSLPGDPAGIASMLLELAQPNLYPEQVTCVFGAGGPAMRAVARELRRAGFKVGLSNSFDNHYLSNDIEAVEPDLIAIERSWFHRVCQEPSAVNLLKSLVTSYRRKGGKVFIDGVDGVDHLMVGSEVAADLLQGDLLGKAAVAGAVMETKPRTLDDIFESRANVLPFGRRIGARAS
jgi:hypothetical protein